MIDSSDVLFVLKIVYTIYAFIAILIVARFAITITRTAKTKWYPSTKAFWTYVALLTALGTGLHFFTYGAIPWVAVDLERADSTPDKSFDITFEKHTMTFSKSPMQIACGEAVVFNATSKDLTYGFGIFRQDNTMVAQMQVVPKSRNDLMWRFSKNGTYSVRSTEYSGPKGARMIAKDALVVTGCEVDDTGFKGGAK